MDNRLSDSSNYRKNILKSAADGQLRFTAGLCWSWSQELQVHTGHGQKKHGYRLVVHTVDGQMDNGWSLYVTIHCILSTTIILNVDSLQGCVLSPQLLLVGFGWMETMLMVARPPPIFFRGETVETTIKFLALYLSSNLTCVVNTRL